MERVRRHAFQRAGSLLGSAAAVVYMGKGHNHAFAADCSGAVKHSSPPDMSNKVDILQRMHDLRSTYHARYAFPAWVVDVYATTHFEDFMQDASRVAIFFDEGENAQVALNLATMREPVNIAMKQRFDATMFSKLFGWSTGLYGELAGSQGSHIPPNIAVLCSTPVVSGMKSPDDKALEKQLAEISDPLNRVNVLNVIAYAFDSPDQPDQRYFLGADSSRISDDKREELIRRLEGVFNKVFAAAIYSHSEVIVLSKFGAAAFAQQYPGNMNNDVWIPAFRQALANWTDRLRLGNVYELSLMGAENDACFNVAVKEHGFTTTPYTYFPEPLRGQLKGKLSKALLVNAWDPWSFVGNGNFADNSLDGFMGRSTAMAVLCSPLTNPHLALNLVSVPVRKYSKM